MNHLPKMLCLFIATVVISTSAFTADPAPLKLGEWAASGDGKLQADAFVHEGRRPLLVSNPALAGKAYLLHADLLLPTPAAGMQLYFTEPPAQPAGKVKPAPPRGNADPDPNAPLAPLGRIALAKDGQTVQIGRQSFPRPGAARPEIPLLIVVTPATVDVYIGPERESRARRAGQPVDLFFALTGGATVKNFKLTLLPESPMIPLIDAGRIANTTVTGAAAPIGRIDPAALPRGLTSFHNVPFYFAESDRNAMDVSTSMAGLKDPVRNKTFYSSKSTKSEGRLVLGAPGDQYAALHLIAFSAGRPNHVPRTTLRIGHYGDRAGIMEDIVVPVPLLSAGEGAAPTLVKLADGKQGFLHHLRIPLPQTANVKEFARFDLEFTRDMSTHINPPDPAEYGKMPVGLPSDVAILAATLEPSPVTMTHRAAEPGNVFHDTQKATFTLTLKNRSKSPQNLRAFARITGPGTGEELGITPESRTVEHKLTLAPGQSQDVTLDVTPRLRGWYACAIGIENDHGLLQQRDTTFAILAPDTRQATTDSPFGVWEFWFPHSVARAPDQVETLASLIHKGGWRWTYGGSPAPRGEDPTPIYRRMRDQYKIVWTAHSLPEGYQRGAGWFDQAKFDATMPEAIKHAMEIYDPTFKVLHESRSSSDLIRRYSEYFGGKPYDMPADEKARLESQIENVRKYTLGIKKIEPRARIVLFNDYPAVANEYLSRGFPAEAFDVIGLEGAMFMREPERQPDWMCLLGNLHQMKRAQAKFGYHKPVWTTEALYHPTEAGGLSLHRQGVIAVREAMLALQLGVERMVAAGIIKDPSDDYHWSNWGSAGFCFRDPEINPKPSYAMYAWLTQILDRAKPAGKLAAPNNSLHVVDFQKADGSHVYAVWTVRGAQEVTFKHGGKAALHDAFGNPVPPRGEGLKLIASPTPIYITGATLEAVASAMPLEQAVPAGKPLLDLDKPEMLRVAEGRNEVLESAWETPRLKGQFETAYGVEDGVTALRVTLKPDADPRKLLPRYVQFDLASPITLEGRPGEFTCRVKGNSGWGRIMFEVVDAKGRIWTSCGNQYAGATNAADSRGDSFISFEGWQTIRFPIVGMVDSSDQTAYRPDNYNWWPTNAPEIAEVEKKSQEAKTAHESEVNAHATAMEAYKAAHAQWQTAAAAAKVAGKAIPAEPRAPVAPVFRPVRNMGLAAVDYPLKLTRLIVEMRPHILYVDEQRPVGNPTIHIDSLGVNAQ